MQGLVLLTGVTGFIGKVACRRLLRDLGCEVAVVIRPKHGKTAEQRWQRVTENNALNDLSPELLARVTVVGGDLRDPELYANPALERLRDRITCVIHLGASIDLEASLENAIQDNVAPLPLLWGFANACPRCKEFVYVSTAYVMPPGRDPIGEVSCPVPGLNLDWVAGCLAGEAPYPKWKTIRGHHHTAYSLSKAVGEHLLSRLRESDSDPCNLTIVRPSSVSVSLHDPYPGYNDSLDAGHGVLAMFTLGVWSGTPAPGVTNNFVPVDHVARILCDRVREPSSSGREILYACVNVEHQIESQTMLRRWVDWTHACGVAEPYRRVRVRYAVRRGFWGQLAFLIHDLGPILLVSLFQLFFSRRRYRKLRRLSQMLLTVHGTLRYYGSRTWAFAPSATCPIEPECYLKLMFRGVTDTMVNRRMLRPKADPPESRQGRTGERPIQDASEQT